MENLSDSGNFKTRALMIKAISAVAHSKKF